MLKLSGYCGAGVCMSEWLQGTGLHRAGELQGSNDEARCSDHLKLQAEDVSHLVSQSEQRKGSLCRISRRLALLCAGVPAWRLKFTEGTLSCYSESTSTKTGSQDSPASACGWRPNCVLGWELAFSFLIMWPHVNFSLLRHCVLPGHMLLLNHLPYLSKDMKVCSKYRQTSCLWPSIFVQGDLCGCLASRLEFQRRSRTWRVYVDFIRNSGRTQQFLEIYLVQNVKVVMTFYVNRQGWVMPFFLCGKAADYKAYI